MVRAHELFLIVYSSWQTTRPRKKATKTVRATKVKTKARKAKVRAKEKPKRRTSKHQTH